MLKNASNCTYICEDSHQNDAPSSRTEKPRDQIHWLERGYKNENESFAHFKKVSEMHLKKRRLEEIQGIYGLK